MARRKSDCVKWTLILVLVLCNRYVYSRPQDDSTLAVPNVTENPTDVNMRYSYNQNNKLFKLPLEKFYDRNTLLNDNHTVNYSNDTNTGNKNSETIEGLIVSRRLGRVRKKYKIRPNLGSKNESNSKKHNKNSNKFPQSNVNDQVNKHNINKPVIKKVITKWTDSVKYDDLNVGFDDDSEERDTNFINVFTPSSFGSTESYEDDNNKNSYYTQQNDQRYTFIHNRPKPLYSSESQVYSNHFQVSDSPYITRPNYVFTTPTPTPIITNVGYPMPWPGYNIQSTRRPTTRKPIYTVQTKKPSYHKPNQNLSPYPGNNFEVTTFPPTVGYTDRIVIRPQEYASSEDCPTIYVTLNNTFQGQGKEACPDLNIAVNTNVVNKNVVVESDEDTDTTLIDVFGLPLDGSASDEGGNDYTASQENDEEISSASVEGLDYSGYNAANTVSNGESSESINVASPSNALSTYTKPTRPNQNDDDSFSFSSLIDFFKPAISAFNWLAAINPLSFGVVSFLLAPLMLLVAGASGLAALFSPWSLSGREAPEEYFYRPHWEWDDYYKTWHLNSFPNSRSWQSEISRSNIRESYSTNSVRPTLFYKVKEFLKNITKIIKNKNSISTDDKIRKNKRKRREVNLVKI